MSACIQWLGWGFCTAQGMSMDQWPRVDCLLACSVRSSLRTQEASDRNPLPAEQQGKRPQTLGHRGGGRDHWRKIVELGTGDLTLLFLGIAVSGWSLQDAGGIGRPWIDDVTSFALASLWSREQVKSGPVNDSGGVATTGRRLRGRAGPRSASSLSWPMGLSR